MDSVNLLQQCQSLTEYWSPRVVGRVNDQYVKVAKLKGEFVWHQHDGEDELFLVLRGKLAMHLQDRVIEISAGEFFVVPKGVSHKPVAAEECLIALIETVTTKHTGELQTPLTRSIAEQVG